MFFELHDFKFTADKVDVSRLARRVDGPAIVDVLICEPLLDTDVPRFLFLFDELEISEGALPVF